MSTFDSQQRKNEEKAAQEDRIQYVEELASALEYPEGDAWISLTDAARVTRTSEAMARRWVTSGRLRVKKEAVGIPPCARLVRLSDVAAIRLIVDPTAAITSEVRKLDLPSIPRQQLQIMEEHHHLLAQTEALRVTVERETADLRRDLDGLEAQLHVRHDALIAQMTKYRRQIDRHGYVRFKHWRLYGERGLVGEDVSVWVYEGNLKVEYQATALSLYELSIEKKTGETTQSRMLCSSPGDAFSQPTTEVIKR